MVKLKRFFYILGFILVVNISPTAKTLDSFFEPVVCQAMTYDDFKAKVSKITSGAKNFWADSAADRAKLAKKAKKKWSILQKKIAKQYKKAKKQGAKGLRKFKKWRRQQEREFWQWYHDQVS